MVSRFCLLLIALSCVAPSTAAAREKFAKKEGKQCGHCHVFRGGGGPRNTIGLYYQATRSLPEDTSPSGMLHVEAAVQELLKRISETPPPIDWGYVPVSQQASEAAPQLEPASQLQLLRRMSLDLRGSVPRQRDVARLQSGKASLDDILEQYLRSQKFNHTFRLYHSDLVRPRTGIFNAKPSLKRIRRRKLGGRTVWSSIPRELRDGRCGVGRTRKVSPYWARKSKIEVCEGTADESQHQERGQRTIRCDTEEGQKTGFCGCGPHLVYCYRGGAAKRIKRSMLQEASRLAMQVVNKNLPYSEVLNADWTMRNGRLDHFYARLDGTLASLKNPDVNRPFRKVRRDARHAGILTTHSYLNFFYNGRRWAQRTYESFMCHQVMPDYDYLDDHADAKTVSYRRHPLAEADINVNSGRACTACHMKLDGLSRVKDRWDNFGQYYAVNPVPQKALFQQALVDGVDGFARAVSRSEVFDDCVVTQAWEHMLGHRFQPTEHQTRLALLEKFQGSNQNFKQLLRDIVKSAEYRAKSSLKIMERELYKNSLRDLTGIKWRLAGRNGFDVFYDKVGGMDYRKIEARDRTPGQGHSLVQFKAAAEICDKLVDAESDRPPAKRRLLKGAKDLSRIPSEAELDAVLRHAYARVYARPWKEVSQEDRAVMRSLYTDVANSHSPQDGYKAVCTTFFGSADFALY